MSCEGKSMAISAVVNPKIKAVANPIFSNAVNLSNNLAP